MPHTWVDGAAADAVPADDRGLNYADGAFETLYCDAGVLSCPDLHEARLASALECLGFHDPQTLASQCFDEMKQLLAEVAHTGVVRCTVTRGSGPRGYAPAATIPMVYMCYHTPHKRPIHLRYLPQLKKYHWIRGPRDEFPDNLMDRLH